LRKKARRFSRKLTIFSWFKMRCNGQLSLEYLLLLLAVLAVFAALLPLLDQTFKASLFGLDSVNAKYFQNKLQHSVNEMDFQANGSKTILEAEPLGQWIVSSSGKILSIKVQGPETEKSFEVFFPNKLVIESKALSDNTSFFLSKVSGKIILEYNNS